MDVGMCGCGCGCEGCERSVCVCWRLRGGKMIGGYVIDYRSRAGSVRAGPDKVMPLSSRSVSHHEFKYPRT